MVLVETWMDRKGWKKIRERLSQGYEWGVQLAKRKCKKGRGIGGMVMGIKKELWEKGSRIEVKREGMIVGRVNTGREKWKVIGVYVEEGGVERTLQGIEEWIGEREGGVREIIGGDFNARTGREGGGVRGEEEEEEEEMEKRRSKDIKINGEGRKLVEYIEEKGWEIFNGSVRGDEEGEYTFTGGRGNTVIDYVIGEGEIRDRIEKMRIGDRVDSDHHPVEVWLRGEEERRALRRKRGGGRRGIWDREGRKRFTEKMGRIQIGGKEIGEEWDNLESKIKEALKETEEELGRAEERRRGWWDEECV
ncbi:uncharacterized protein [Linepithema humile]|uniref:uncharacterized protein n=1 Tax=Linepithema humile TaxID=83485 RepID=UPI00351F4873